MGLLDAFEEFLDKSQNKRDFTELLNKADIWGWAPNGMLNCREALYIVINRCMYGNSGLHYQEIWDNDFPIDYRKAIKYGETAVNCGIHKFGRLHFVISDLNHCTIDLSGNTFNFIEVNIAACYRALKEYDKAEFWYEKAYEQGIKKALCKVGQMYVDRTDGKNDYEKAIKYFEKSIKNDWFVPDNEFMIARLHYEGKGFPEDKAKGLEMIRAAAKKGSEIAKEYMKENGLTMGGMLDD